VQRNLERALHFEIDREVSAKLEPCVVVIALSGIYPQLLRTARGRYGAICIVERGSRHILSQKRILDALRPEGEPSDVAPDLVDRELETYRLADYVSVASQHVVESFVEEGIDASRLLRDPYGVDLAMFQPTPAPPPPPVLLYTGNWSLQKGCDVLVAAWRMLRNKCDAAWRDVRLMHVGAALDAPLPRDEGFEHIDAVDQKRLVEFYARSHVFVHASRQEGLSMVQAQALACGLPLVCTSRTGGADLREFLPNPSDIEVVPPDDAGALASAVSRQLDRAMSETGIRHRLDESARQQISWRGYGLRYHANLMTIFADRTGTNAAAAPNFREGLVENALASKD
jgi:glycosyltransferase involved in cell wall biosynthesis